jgi:hypothetical protein
MELHAQELELRIQLRLSTTPGWRAELMYGTRHADVFGSKAQSVIRHQSS